MHEALAEESRPRLSRQAPHCSERDTIAVQVLDRRVGRRDGVRGSILATLMAFEERGERAQRGWGEVKFGGYSYASGAEVRRSRQVQDLT